MSKFEKDIAKLRQNPKNVRFEQIENILLRLGFTKRQNGTSHATFSNGKSRITVPKKKPFVKPAYVKQVLALIDECFDLDVFEEN